MKVKTSELQGAALDWAVAKCEGLMQGQIAIDGVTRGFYKPSTDWAQGGPIIEREKLGVWWATHYVDDDGVEYGNHWYAETDESIVGDGPTPLIAAMRCYVASKLGDEVEVPDALN
jgi:hypothetical protein